MRLGSVELKSITVSANIAVSSVRVVEGRSKQNHGEYT